MRGSSDPRIAIHAAAGAMPHLFERHRVRLRIADPLAERAQPATRDADVGGIDVAIDVEVSDVSVQALAHQVGYVAEPENVARTVQREAVLKGKPDAGRHLLQNRLQPRIFERHLHDVIHPV